jgi:SRSO17 transposase
VAEELSGEDGIFVIDETSDAKKGAWTAGVARQYCGESGKIDNCIVSVHIAYVREQRHALLDGELFLPEGWNPDSDDPQIADKRRRAQLPPEAVHQPKTRMALAQLDRARANGVQGRYVTADELYGGAPWWRAALAERGLIYVVEVPSRVQGWIGERDGEARSLKDLAATHRRLRCGVKARYTTHETAKGPEVWEARRVPFIEQADAAPAVAQDLLVARNPRTGEVKYFLTNAARSLPTPACLKVAFSRWRVERCFQDCKSELGLNHAELRTYRGLRRHFILTAINYYFLLTRVRGEKGPERGATGRCASGDPRTPVRRVDERRPTPGPGRALGRRHRAHPAAQSPRPGRGPATTAARTGRAGDRPRATSLV